MFSKRKYSVVQITSSEYGNFNARLLQFEYSRKKLVLANSETIDSEETLVKKLPKQVPVGFVIFNDNQVVKPVVDKGNVEKSMTGVRLDEVYWDTDVLEEWVVYSRRQPIDELKEFLNDHNILIDQFRLGFLCLLHFGELINKERLSLGRFEIDLRKDTQALSINERDTSEDELENTSVSFNNEQTNTSEILPWSLAVEHLSGNPLKGLNIVTKDRSELVKHRTATSIIRYGFLCLTLAFLLVSYSNKHIATEEYLVEETKSIMKRASTINDEQVRYFKAIDDLSNYYNPFFFPRYNRIVNDVAIRSFGIVHLREFRIQPVREVRSRNRAVSFSADTVFFVLASPKMNGISNWEKHISNLDYVEEVNFTNISSDRHLMSTRDVNSGGQIVTGYFTLK